MGKSSKQTMVRYPPTKKVKKGKKDSEDKQAIPIKEEIEVESVALTKKKVKKLKKTLTEPPEEKKEDTESFDFEGEVAAAPIMVSQMKASKKGKRSNDDDNDSKKHQSFKKQKIELEMVVPNNKKIKKLKNALIEPMGKMKDGTCISDFEEEVAAAPIMISQMKGFKKGKRSNDDESDTKKRKSSKKQKNELEMLVPNNKRVKKLKNALIEPMGKMKDGTCISDFEEEDTDKEGKNLLTGDAESKKSCKIFENEVEAPNNRDEKSHAKRLFVGNLSPEIIKDDLLEFFKEAGEVIEIQLHAKEDGSFRGFGHVEFATAADAQRAFGKNYGLLLGRRVMIDYAVEKGSNNPPKGKTVQDSAHCCVYVKGFGKSLGEDQVRNYLMEHFGSCGDIIRVSIPQDNKTGRSKGFAYIMFNDVAAVSKALMLNDTKLGTCILTVEQPTPKIGAPDGAYRGGRGNKGRSANQGWGHGENGGGRGRGGRGAGAPYNTGETAIKAKRTTFVDND